MKYITPQYRLTLTWRADADGNGVVTLLEYLPVDSEPETLQASFHPTLNLCDAVESACESFFEQRNSPPQDN